MTTTGLSVSIREIVWTPLLIRKLRGKRTQAAFGKLLGIPKNTVWRWEAGQATPTPQNGRRLTELAGDERFMQGWRLAGSLELRGNLEESRPKLHRNLRNSLAQSARDLRE